MNLQPEENKTQIALCKKKNFIALKKRIQFYSVILLTHVLEHIDHYIDV